MKRNIIQSLIIQSLREPCPPCEIFSFVSPTRKLAFVEKPRDVDLSLLTGFGREAVFVNKLIERYEANEARIENPETFA
jgi:hypothetical protein